jgi:hypothetical protein
LCPNNDGEALKFALVSLLSAMIIAEMKTKDPSLSIELFNSWLANIVHPQLHAKVQKDPLFGHKIRENAYIRVETLFRWKKVSEKLKNIYLSL